MYQILNDGSVQHLRTSQIVSNNPEDQSYADFEAWKARGNVPAPSQRSARQQQVWERIKAHRDELKASGVRVGDHWFHSDVDSRIQQLALKELGSAIPEGVPWKTMSGAFVPMTPELALQIFFASVASDVQIFSVAEAHRAAMQLVDDPETYDFSTGWPDKY